MDSWNKFNETSWLNKECFYNNLNMERINDTDYIHANRVFKVFNNKNIGDYHNYMFKAIHYYLQMYLEILEISVLKNMNLIQLIFCLCQD